MFSLFRRSVDLKSHLRRTKKICVNGVTFEIRKVSLEDHMAGLNVVLQMHDVYKKEKPKDKAAILEDNAKLKKFIRDFIYAGVASPTLSLKSPPEEGTIAVDELINSDFDMAQKLCSEIIAYSYSKKK